MSIIIQFRYRT